MQQQHVGGQRIGIAQPVDGPEVDIDFRVQRMEARQRGQDHLVRELRMGSNGQCPAGPLGRAPQGTLGLAELLHLGQQWPAAVEVLAAARCRPHAACAALQQRESERAFQCAHQLLDGGHADLQPLRRPREAAFLAGRNEIFDGLELVHGGGRLLAWSDGSA
jgi:hypothetical protein